MKPNHRIGGTLIVAGLLLVLFSGMVVSFFGTTTVESISRKDYWMQVTRTIPTDMAANWTRAIIGAGIVICAFGTWILLRRNKKDSN
jgi:hypothetical protein